MVVKLQWPGAKAAHSLKLGIELNRMNKGCLCINISRALALEAWITETQFKDV